jgi:hypothetical protein
MRSIGFLANLRRMRAPVAAIAREFGNWRLARLVRGRYTYGLFQTIVT